MKPVRALVQEDYDRAAPLGVGSTKAAGNYAAGMMGDKVCKEKGFPIALYLDSREHKYIDEFGTSNFFAITKDNKYVTPASKSILQSITNDSLQTLASDMGFTVERRPIEFDEIKDFVEIGACGTAAVITPVCEIVREKTVLKFGNPDEPSETLIKLFKEMQGIQYGDIEDRHNWMLSID
jgi:branched-chain amino acid aminotransferase